MTVPYRHMDIQQCRFIPRFLWAATVISFISATIEVTKYARKSEKHIEFSAQSVNKIVITQ